MLPNATMSRRTLITGAAGFAVALSSPNIVRATPLGRVGSNRLWIQRLDTGETLDAPFLVSDAALNKQAWMLWSHFWRDAKDHNQAVWMDRKLLVVLNKMQMRMSAFRGEEVQIRTPERNATIEGAAPHSYHCKGMASDIAGRGIAHAKCADIGEEVSAEAGSYMGGLGRYPGFTHVDTGHRNTSTGHLRRWGRN